jgi:hypothetical protein
MIITASRRTDIPAFYSDWFIRHLQERYVIVANPINQVKSRIDLSPAVVDGIVFCTKNPLPMLDKLELLKAYAYYFEITLTPYGTDTEAYVPSKSDVIIPAFQRLAEKIGPARVIWRYDPIFLSDKYTPGYHLEMFDKIAARLEGCTTTCIISFLDDYRHIRRGMAALGSREITEADMRGIAAGLSQSAKAHGMDVNTCAEQIDLSELGIAHGRCVDDRLFEKLTGCRLDIKKGKPQRPACGCAPSIDIGAYSTCRHGCSYCYANHSDAALRQNIGQYVPASPILCARVDDPGCVKERAVRSDKCGQLTIFD